MEPLKLKEKQNVFLNYKAKSTSVFSITITIN